MKYFDGELLSGYENQITQSEREFIKTLIIKLDLTIDAERQKINGAGLYTIVDFERTRKKDIIKALDILNGGKNENQ